MDEGLDLVRNYAQMNQVKVPTSHDKVYKDECMFCFASPEAAGGLFINLATWQAFSEDHVDLDHERTGNVLYLWEKWHKVWLVRPLLLKAHSVPSCAAHELVAIIVLLHPCVFRMNCCLLSTRCHFWRNS
jgi:Variant UBP zinc finger